MRVSQPKKKVKTVGSLGMHTLIQFGILRETGPSHERLKIFTATVIHHTERAVKFEAQILEYGMRQPYTFFLPSTVRLVPCPHNAGVWYLPRFKAVEISYDQQEKIIH